MTMIIIILHFKVGEGFQNVKSVKYRVFKGIRISGLEKYYDDDF